MIYNEKTNNYKNFIIALSIESRNKSTICGTGSSNRKSRHCKLRRSITEKTPKNRHMVS